MSQAPAPAVHSGDVPRPVVQASLAVYGAMTLLGIVEAAIIKGVVERPVELAVVMAAGSVSIVVAHAWSTVVAHRLVTRQRLTRLQVLEEVWFTAAFLIPLAVGLVAIVATLPFLDFSGTVTAVQVVLLLLIAGVGFVGARRSGATVPRALAWGALDVAVGLLIVGIKEVLSLLATH